MFEKDKEEFLKNLETVFERFKKYGIVHKPKMCQFGMTEIKYVGRVINEQGTYMHVPLPIYFEQLKGLTSKGFNIRTPGRRLNLPIGSTVQIELRKT